MHNNTHALRNRFWKGLLKLTYMLLVITLSGAILATTVSAQSVATGNTKTGSVLGRVVDPSDDPIPGANVVLRGRSGDRLTAVTKEDGSFALEQAQAGVTHQITVTAEGFVDWNS